MTDFAAYLMKEFKRFLRLRNLLVWFFINVLILIIGYAGINQYKKTNESRQLFKNFQKKYFETTHNYDRYGKDGINVLFEPSSLNSLFKNTIIPEDLSGNINSIVKLDITNNLKEASLESSNLFFKIDFSIIVLLVLTMTALLFGYQSLGEIEYLKMLSSSKCRLKVFNLVMFSRFILFTAAFLISFALVILLFHIRGLILTPSDYTALGVYLLQTLTMLLVFFFIGGLLGILKSRELAYILLFVSWFTFIFIFTGVVHSMNKSNIPEITHHYQILLNKFEKVIKFEKNAVKKYGKFDKKDIETARKVIESFWSKDFKEIVAMEKALRSKIVSYIQSYQRSAVLTPVTFYISTCNEVSSRGYENYIEFYDYLIGLRIDFSRFWIDRVYYDDPQVMRSFIRENEDIFIAQADLPVNYWTGVLMDVFYALAFYLLSYLGFKRRLNHMESKELVFPREVYIELDKNDLIIWKITGNRLNRLLYRVFSGDIQDLKSKGFNGEILVDNIDITTEKNNKPYLYVCKPEDLPGDIKLKDLLNFYSRWSLWSRQPLEKRKTVLNRAEIKPLMDKYIGKLEDHDRYNVLMALVEMQKSNIYIYHFYKTVSDLALKYELNFKSQIEQLINRGSIVLFLTTPRIRRLHGIEENGGFEVSKGWLYQIESSKELLKYSEEH